jgi:hypothetical protein
MPKEITLTKEDLSLMKERLNDPSLQAGEKELLKALVRMAEEQPAQGRPDVAWFFIWQ